MAALTPPMNASPRIDLERLRVEHAPAMFEGLADAKGYAFLPDNPPVSVEALMSRYEHLVSGGPLDGTETWLNWIIKKSWSDILVGYTQATIQDRQAVIGYYVFPAYWRQGFATAALQATLCELFKTYSMNELHAFVDTRNVASIAVLAKLGFTRLRTIAEADSFKGGPSDEYEFVLSDARWRNCLMPT